MGMFTVKKVPLDVEIVDSHPKYGPHFIFTVAYDTNMEETDVVKTFKPATATLVVIVAVYVYLVFFINWAYLFLFPPLVAAGILFFYNVSPFAPMEGIAQFRVNIKDITGWNHRSLLTDHAEVSLETKSLLDCGVQIQQFQFQRLQGRPFMAMRPCKAKSVRKPDLKRVK